MEPGFRGDGSMETVVVSIGGSIVAPPNLDVQYIDSLARTLKELVDEGRKIYCVTGGGWIARQYIEAARAFGAGEEELDLIGIAATRINASLLIAALSKYMDVPVRPMASTDATVDSSQGYKVAVMGGTYPGHSTDFVGAELAQKTKAARFINATNVDGVYSADPNVVATAEFYSEITIDNLIKMMGTEWKLAGTKAVIDGPACQLIRDGRVPTFVVNGRNLPEFAKAVRGEPFHGTRVLPAAVKPAAPAAKK
jgi:uridylate kinase